MKAQDFKRLYRRPGTLGCRAASYAGCGNSGNYFRILKRPVPEGPMQNLRDDPAIDAVDLEGHLRIVFKSDVRLLDRVRRRAFAVPLSEDMREAGGEDRGGSVYLNSFGRFAKWIPPRLCRHHHWCQRVEVGLIRRLPVSRIGSSAACELALTLVDKLVALIDVEKGGGPAFENL